MSIMLNKYKIAQVVRLKMSLRHPTHNFVLHSTDQRRRDLRIDIYRQDEKILSCSVDQLYRSYLLAPEELDHHCEQMLTPITNFISVVQEDDPILLPMVLTRKRLDEIQRKTLKDKRNSTLLGDTIIPSIPLISGLVVVLVLDATERIIYLNTAQLNEHFPNHTFEEAYTIALDNLKTVMLPRLKVSTDTLVGATIEVGNHYEASMLLIFKEWQARLPFTAPPAIAIAARDTIILVNSSQANQVKALKNILFKTHGQVEQGFAEQILTIYNDSIQLLEKVSL